MMSVFPQWGFTFIYIGLVTSNDVSIRTVIAQFVDARKAKE
jgi:hypothetical protein